MNKEMIRRKNNVYLYCSHSVHISFPGSIGLVKRGQVITEMLVNLSNEASLSIQHNKRSIKDLFTVATKVMTCACARERARETRPLCDLLKWDSRFRQRAGAASGGGGGGALIKNHQHCINERGSYDGFSQ